MTSLLTSLEVTAPPRVLDLRAHGDRVAIHTPGGRLTYAELADRVDDVARRLGPTRRLVLVEGSNTIESLATYLAALTHGHVVLLAPAGDPAARLADAWDPDVVVGDARSSSGVRAAPTTSTPISRSCSARPGRPAPRSWYACPTTTSAATRPASPSTSD